MDIFVTVVNDLASFIAALFLLFCLACVRSERHMEEWEAGRTERRRKTRLEMGWE